MDKMHSTVANIIFYALWFATMAVAAIAACELPAIVTKTIAAYVIYQLITSIILWALRIRNAGKE